MPNTGAKQIRRDWAWCHSSSTFQSLTHSSRYIFITSWFLDRSVTPLKISQPAHSGVSISSTMRSHGYSRRLPSREAIRSLYE